MDSLAYASLSNFSNISLRLEPCKVPREHHYIMQPASVERFVYISKGEANFFVGTKKLLAKERDMVYLPRNTAYQSTWLCDSQFMVVDLRISDEEGIDIRFGEEATLLFNDKNHVYDILLSDLVKKSDTSGPFDWLERLYLSLKFLCQVARDTKDSERGENLIKQGVDFLENNFTKNFPIDDLAKMSALSPGYFRKLFLALKDTSPSDYRNSLRIKYACELLLSGSYTVGEVAELVGVHDVKYFSKLFIKYTGIKPSEFKKKRKMK